MIGVLEGGSIEFPPHSITPSLHPFHFPTWPCKDLTPQLRTRSSRMERAVGWFVILATLLLVVRFSYYIYRRRRTKSFKKSSFRIC